MKAHPPSLVERFPIALPTVGLVWSAACAVIVLTHSLDYGMLLSLLACTSGILNGMALLRRLGARQGALKG